MKTKKMKDSFQKIITLAIVGAMLTSGLAVSAQADDENAEEAFEIEAEAPAAEEWEDTYSGEQEYDAGEEPEEVTAPPAEEAPAPEAPQAQETAEPEETAETVVPEVQASEQNPEETSAGSGEEQEQAELPAEGTNEPSEPVPNEMGTETELSPSEENSDETKKKAPIQEEIEYVEMDPGDLDPAYAVSHLEYGTPLVSDEDISADYDREENLAAVFRFLTTELELNSAAASGVLANILAESDGNPRAAGDGRTSYGICQWHTGRFTELVRYCGEKELDYRSLEGQLSYLRYELENRFPWILTYLRELPNTEEGAYDAGAYWCRMYEAPSDRSAQARSRGETAAKELLSRFYEETPGYVTLDYTGGKGEVSRLKVWERRFLGTLPEGARPGYVFDGWYTEPEGGRKIYAFSVYTESTPDTFYAHWLSNGAATREQPGMAEEIPFEADPAIGNGRFRDPVDYNCVTSNYGWRLHPIYDSYRFHAGMDLGAGNGREIYAADNGTVIIAGWDPQGYGNFVVIDHNNGYQTLYAHQSALAVELGDVVTQGQVIGYVGATGAATGPHLHYEVWQNYTTVDPADFLLSVLTMKGEDRENT